MPTFDTLDRFMKDFSLLGEEDRMRFRAAVERFVEDLRGGQGFRPGLRVKRVQGTDGIWEMTWAPDGRATWMYGDEVLHGEPHVVWRRVGTHDVFGAP